MSLTDKISNNEVNNATSYNIVKLALMHKEPSRLPLDIGGTRVTGIHISAYLKYRKELGLPDINPDMQIRYLQLPKVDMDFRSLIGGDLISADPLTAAEETEYFSDNNGSFYIDRWGCKWFKPENGHYYDITSFPLADAHTASDINSFKWPNEKSPLIHANIECEAHKIVNLCQRALVLGRTSPGIYEMLHILCGYEKALTDLAGNPALSEAIMDKILELKLMYYSEAIPKVIASGTEYFIISESDDLGSQNGLIMSPKMYRTLIKPRHTALFKEIKRLSNGRAMIELHCCGAIREIIPDLTESGVEILNPIQVSAVGMDDTKALKRDFGKDIVFHGGGVDSQYTLPYGTPEEVRDETKRRIDDLAPGGGFIFTPVHSIQHDVPFRNFMAMLEAYRECAG